jgi:hypothetical protein
MDERELNKPGPVTRVVNVFDKTLKKRKRHLMRDRKVRNDKRTDFNFVTG